MQFSKLLLFIFLLFLSKLSLIGQDLHWTQFTMLPINLNPALTGDFEGTFRIGGLYKNQYNNTYSQPAFFVDVPVIMVRKRDWLSVGVGFAADRAGTLKLATTRSLISASYHLALDKKSKNYFVVGYQSGSDKLQLKETRPDIVIAADPNDTRLSGQGTESQSVSMHNIGLMYRSAVNRNTNLNLGFVVSYITNPTESIGSGGTYRRDRKFILHGQLSRKLNSKVTIEPAFIAQLSDKNREIMVQAIGSYLFKPEINLSLKAGLGYDLDQGPQLFLGSDFGDWKIGLAFDFPVYGVLKATNTFGGFEIAVNRIIRIYKKPEVKPAICCPDL